MNRPDIQSLVHDVQKLYARNNGKVSTRELEAVVAAHLLQSAHLYDAMRKIEGSIQNVKVELSTSPAELKEEHIPGANLELEAVVKSTEEAANRILDAAEKIQALADGGSPRKDDILAQITEIFEASNFQDLTGQRIRKVIKCLKDIDRVIEEFLAEADGKIHIATKKAKKKNKDEELMEGPQLETPSQDDVDKLFESL